MSIFRNREPMKAQVRLETQHMTIGEIQALVQHAAETGIAMEVVHGRGGTWVHSEGCNGDDTRNWNAAQRVLAWISKR